MERVRPADLEMPALRTAFRGYDKLQVHDLLNKAHHEVATLVGELSAARSEIDRLRAQLEARQGEENTIKDALLAAQRAADELRANAQKEAAAALADARHRAEEAVREYEGRINNLRWDLERLRLQRERYVRDYTALLESHLRSLTEETVATEAVVDDRRHEPAAHQGA